MDGNIPTVTLQLGESIRIVRANGTEQIVSAYRMNDRGVYVYQQEPNEDRDMYTKPYFKKYLTFYPYEQIALIEFEVLTAQENFS